MNNEPIKHDKAFPPSASAGGDNAYYLKGCETVQRSPAYASCLFKITEFEAGRSHDIYRDCHEAIRMRKCLALGMREEEQLKGVALYFFPRIPPQVLTLPLTTTGEFGVRVSNLTPPNLLPKDPKPAGRFHAGVNKSPVKDKATALDRELAAADQGYAGAINAALEDLAAPASPDIKVRMQEVIKVTAASIQPAKPAMQPGESPLAYARRIAAQNAINQQENP